MNKYRQGDVILIEDNTIETKKSGPCILAYGEVSGHKHELSGDVKYTMGSNGLATMVEIGQVGAILQHDSHDSIQIPQGKYRVRLQREFDIVEGISRQVLD